MHLGLKIKIARITKGMTQEELAGKINKTRPLVSHIEQTGKVNFYTLKKICTILGLDPFSLENELSEPSGNYQRDDQNYKQEIKRLKEEISVLKELVSVQKEVVNELRKKLQGRRKK
jgi:transcriptional regulator with XRE-family HTH domain